MHERYRIYQRGGKNFYAKYTKTGRSFSLSASDDFEATLEGEANGAAHPDASSYAKKFSAKNEHRTITGGIGHNLPQEAPQIFAKAAIDVDGY